jgi:hypothetical protein
MKKLSNQEVKTIAVIGIGVIVLIGAIVAGKRIFQFLGLAKSEPEKKAEKAQEKVIEKTTDEIKQKEQKGEKPSYSDAQYIRTAEVIHKNTYTTAISDNDDAAITELLRFTPKDVDYLKIVQAYGSRVHYAFGIPLDARTLPELISQEFDSAEKAKINNNFKSRGMKTRVS